MVTSTAGPARPDVSAAIGSGCRPCHHTPDFAVGHHAALTLLDGSPTPGTTWLHTGPTDPPLLAARDRAAPLAALRQRAGGPVEHLAHALTADPHALGDPAAALTRVAAGPGGLGTVSWLLQVLAWRLDPEQGVILFAPSTSRGLPPARHRIRAGRVTTVGALTADLPPAMSAGPETRW
ncbi:hypothetical protein [Streptomyces sp. NPDC058701]|uniref:hypothetical protein n=1 Tax=Streptomyces sp. NPDC058701 TaxID=3346608 RepID=UPI00364D912A